MLQQIILLKSFWTIYGITCNSKLSLYSLYQFGIAVTVVSVFVMIHYFFCSVLYKNCSVTAVSWRKMILHGIVCLWFLRGSTGHKAE